MVLNCQIVRLESSWRREFKIKVSCLPPPPVFLVYASCFYAVALPPIPFVFFSFSCQSSIFGWCPIYLQPLVLILSAACQIFIAWVPATVFICPFGDHIAYILTKIISCLVMLSQCYETHIYYCWLHLYSGSRQANNNYILISTFIPCMCHRSLHWLRCGNSS